MDWSEFDDDETPDRLWEIMLSNITKALDAIGPMSHYESNDTFTNPEMDQQ